MEVLEFDGKKYVKATKVARDLGYTADYVGQLCRGGKVGCHLVGRSWYVDQDAVGEHKATRYRSSKTKTREALKDEVHKIQIHKDPDLPRSKIQRGENTSSLHFYTRTSERTGSYAEDTAELMPVLTKKQPGTTGTELEVEVACAKELEVGNSAREYVLKATELPKIRFKGSLSVSDYELEEKPKEGQNEPPGAPVHIKSVETQNKNASKSGSMPSEDTKTKKVNVRESDFRERLKRRDSVVRGPTRMRITGEQSVHGERVSLTRGSVVAMTRKQALTEEPTEGTLSIENVSSVTGTVSVGMRPSVTYISAAFFLALSLSLGILALDYRVSGGAPEHTYISTYGFAISNIQEAVSAFK